MDFSIEHIKWLLLEEKTNHVIENLEADINYFKDSYR